MCPLDGFDQGSTKPPIMMTMVLMMMVVTMVMGMMMMVVTMVMRMMVMVVIMVMVTMMVMVRVMGDHGHYQGFGQGPQGASWSWSFQS